MDFKEIVLLAYALAVGVLGFYLKRTYNQIDRLEADKASKKDLETTRGDLDRLSQDVGSVKTNYLTKEDFFREQAKTDRKLDQIMQILLDIKGGGKTNG